jgi:opacity protein-like surface antigen
MRRAFIVFASMFVVITASAQSESYVHEGEFGISAGTAHYFGDLNTRARLNRPKIALGAFFRKQFGNYVALRVSAHYAQLGYSDVYNNKNEFEFRRNLSFNTNLWELALQGDFNFFRFEPGTLDYAFTPYVTIGVGAFSYDPYAYYQGQKVFLRPLGTEGQGLTGYDKQYSSMAFCIPFGAGVKYNINEKVNIGFEVVYRFTTTDYLDDVSNKYPNPADFPKNPDGSLTLSEIMSDRSGETGLDKIGFVNGSARQRGFPKQKDQYIMAEITLSFNLTSYRCPKAD